MKSVVLDGYTLSPGDISWEEVEAFGETLIYDRTGSCDTVARAKGAEVVFTNKTEVGRAEIDALLPELKYIGVLATGYNVVDVAYAHEKGVVVTNVPGYGYDAVAQMVFALILELTNRVAHHDATVKAGKWAECEDFCYWDYPQVGLSGLTLGIFGYGGIGKGVANLARAFGMTVLVHTRTMSEGGDGVTFCDRERLIAESDVITLHCPLTEATHKMVDEAWLASMKETGYLINTSRGAVIDETALASALNTGQIAGAGLDVLDVEPPSPDNPLLAAKNCYITPHIAWATRNARARLMDIAVDNLQQFLAGTPQNTVPPAAR
ncbi:glycerate dehydrogenase [Desulfoluna limicola]|uniref:Glycerate dehydrogenase n=1 Tax=Desulfoluna limicola TaxID=2810562 RepID=A0ABM7PP20_9BACT|nr:D-2-hydroxyacid dehydrogenase [Desulfoluna limicola]BCS99037.1 glycerate dehydrogenase [Desulfoluna limicola]